jgi:c-di-GMP-binding flagellar brake protein YcgR
MQGTSDLELFIHPAVESCPMDQVKKILLQRRLSLRRSPKRSSRVRCRKGALGLGPNLALRLLDISEGGVRLIVASPLEPQQEVEISLLPPAALREVVRKGAVVWSIPTESGEFCIGIKFEKRLDYAVVCDLSVFASA